MTAGPEVGDHVTPDAPSAAASPPATTPAAGTMPVIEEGKTLAASQPSTTTLSAPGTGGNTLSTETSLATLAPPAVMSTKSSSATLVTAATALPSIDNLEAANLEATLPAPSEKVIEPEPALAPVAAAPAAAAAVAPPPQDDRPKAKKNPFALKDETKTQFKDFWRIFSYSTWWDRVLIFFAVVASILTGITMPLMNVVFGRVFSSFSGYDSEGNVIQITEDMFMQEMIICVMFLIYIFIGRLVLDYVSFLGFRMSSMRISARIRLEYMRAVFAQPVSTLDLVPPGQTAAMITIMANTLQTGISEKLSSFLQSVSLLVSAMVISFLYSWNLTLVTGSGMVLIILVYTITTPILVRIMNKVQDAEIQASTVANEIFASIRMVAACGAESKMMSRYEAWVKESRRRGLRMSPLIACQQAPIFFAIYGTFALTFWYCLHQYMKGAIGSPQSLIVVLFSVMMMTTAIGGITTPLSAAARAAGAASIFYSVIDTPKPKTGTLKAPEVSAAQDIILANVNFAYPGRPDIKVLDDVSLVFPAGKMTAIVGPSGSGKSTIVSLIERWYELDGDMVANPMVFWMRNGWISTGAQQLKDIDVKWWRSQIGLVQQEPFLFNDTIYRNVEHGLVGTEWEHAPTEVKSKLVENACKEAFADEFISRLPDGYATAVGDAGIKLSGGQRQRLAIARAIVRQPKILILDEATSAIDVRGEQMVQAALDKAAQGRTTIAIAHRLSTIKKADNIVVLRKGRVVEQGTHEALMAVEGGAYWTLASAQQLSLGSEDDEEGGDIDEKKGEAAAEGGKLKEGGKAGTAGDEKKSIDLIVTEESAFGGDSTTIAASQDGVRKERGLIGSFGMLLREQKSQWPWYIMLIGGAIGGGASAPVQAYLFAMLMSLFSFFGYWELLDFLTNFWCLMFTVLAIGMGISYFALGWAATTTSFNIIHYYRKEVLHNILAKPVSFFDAEEHNVGALTARLATDPTQLQQLLGMNMAFVIISFFNVVGCLIISFVFGWKLTVVTVLTSMPIILGAAFLRVKYEREFEKKGNAVFAESAKFATESISAFRTVSSLTLEDSICNRYERLLQHHIKTGFLKAAISTFVFAMSDSIALLCMAFVLWYGGKLMASHEYWPFQFVIVYIAVMQGGIGAGGWLSFGPNIAQASVAANRIIDLRRKEHNDGRLTSLDVGDLGNDDKGARIDFRNVWFRYPTRDVPILNGLTMTIEKGQFAAVVGPSGSGKTTVISLLERFYRVNAGRILYNGLDVSDLNLRNYRRDISLVAQEPNLFDGTLRENILLGLEHDDGAATDEEMYQACRDAGIHDFIVSLPEGYATEVGTKGVALSGGQKQRISIARALIRNPRLLLLDEATSNLDSETERQVQAVFERTKAERTMVVVAHRLATVQNADVIFVLGDGKVLEKGNHAALLKKKGVYYQMCQSQALDR